ncbi:MAG: aminotransferase class IV [Simkaniaceae bacterium]|nr:aminotransferase class IV [Candidatus Sacchlamyda saccharinae]
MFIHYADGEFTENPKIETSDLGLTRGYGVFDYARLYQGKPFHLTDHLKRLLWSAEQIGLELTTTLEDLLELTQALIEKNPPIDAGIRFLITGGEPQENHLLAKGDPKLLMLFQPYTPPPHRYYKEGMRLCTTNNLRILPSVKTTNYMPAIFGMKKAKEMGFDDALYVNGADEILEATTSNVFFFKKETLITPDADIVKGVTRSIFLELAKEEFPIECRTIHHDEIKDCDEAFLTSSIKGGIPLVQVDDQTIGKGLPGPYTRLLCEKFEQYLTATPKLILESRCV